MDAADIAVAAFAPAVVWVLWRLQSLTVDQVLRRGMYKLLRHQRVTYNIVSWFGVLLHEVSHALFLVLGGHGIRRFKVGVDSGHVVPQQMRRGPFGVITFVVAAMAPMFVAPALILTVAWWLLDPALVTVASAGPGWDEAWPVLRDMLVAFPGRLGRALVGVDLATWRGLLVFGLMVFALPSARPSYLAGKGGEKDQGDIAVVRAKVRRNAVTFVVLAALLVASYFVIVPWAPRIYWAAWQAVWATALTAILLAAAAGVGWYVVSRAGRAQFWAAWLPLAAAVAVQVLGRQGVLPDMQMWLLNVVTLGVFAVLAFGVAAAAPRRW